MQKGSRLSIQLFVFADRLYGQASADDVVQSVRRLRAERDQLRLRDRDHSRSMRQVGHHLCIRVSVQGRACPAGVGPRCFRAVALYRVKCCTTLLFLQLLCYIVLSTILIKNVS